MINQNPFKICGAELLGQFLRSVNLIKFRGKGRLIGTWLKWRNVASVRERILPGGARIKCNLSIPYEAMVWLRHEEEVDLLVLQHLLHPGDVFVDCGANIGIWSLTASAGVGQAGVVYAIEPNMDCAKKLENSIGQNALQNVRLIHKAVWSKPGEAMYLTKESEHNRGRTTETSTTDSIEVSTTTLDTLIPASVQVAGIKIDIEGCELPALHGSEGTITRCHPWICIELNTVLSGVSALNDWPVHAHLKRLGYSVRRFDQSMNSHQLPDSWQTTGHCNLFYFFEDTLPSKTSPQTS